MELKLARPGIEIDLTLSFNRTFMELKLWSKRENVAVNATFNRTFMELKLETSAAFQQAGVF